MILQMPKKKKIVCPETHGSTCFLANSYETHMIILSHGRFETLGV